MAQLLAEYEGYKALNLKLDMTRGKPSKEQLDTLENMLCVLRTNEQCVSGGIDCRNYGVIDGIPAAKRIFSELLEVPASQIIIGGNSSLNLMFDTVGRAMIRGVAEGEKPWSRYEKITFICPAPGYDRHFAICEYFGINMITVPMTETGPDMDEVERLAASDETVKGIWCVPKYANPTGVTYSSETVRRFAALKPKAKDFRVFWDNAYAMHDLSDTPDKLDEILSAARRYGNEDLFYVFASTSKISYAGAGIAAMASSEANIKRIISELGVQTIGYDKLNQLRHAMLFPDLESVKAQMKVHLELIKPKFKAVLDAFERELSDIEGVSWTKPNGGYFISLEMPKGTAKRLVSLAKEAGLALTKAGATYPYGIDPNDSNIRIAPTYPSLAELEVALPLLCCCVKIAAGEAKK